MRLQIQSYGSDFDVERHSREQLTTENLRLKQQIKETEIQFQRIRDDFTTERTTRELLATSNDRLKQEIQTCKAELAVEKEQREQLTVDNDRLRIQVADKDEQLNQLNVELVSERAEKQYAEHISQLKVSGFI